MDPLIFDFSHDMLNIGCIHRTSAVRDDNDATNPLVALALSVEQSDCEDYCRHDYSTTPRRSMVSYHERHTTVHCLEVHRQDMRTITIIRVARLQQLLQHSNMRHQNPGVSVSVQDQPSLSPQTSI